MDLKKRTRRNIIVGIFSVIGLIFILYTLPEVLIRAFYFSVSSFGILGPLFYAGFVLLGYGFIIFTIFFSISLIGNPIESLKGRNIPIQIVNEGRKIVRYTSIAEISIVTFAIVWMDPFVLNMPADFPYYISQDQSNLLNYLGMLIILFASYFYKEYHVALPYHKKDRKGNEVFVGIWKCPCGENNSEARKKCFYCDKYL